MNRSLMKHLEQLKSTIVDKASDESKQLKDQLKELTIAATFYSNLLTHVNQGIVFISAEGVVALFNPAAEEVLGLEAEEVLFRNYNQAFDDQLFGFSIKEVLEKHNGPSFLQTTLSKSSRKITVETQWIEGSEQSENPSPLNEFVNGLVIMIRDITDIQRLELAAAQSDRMKELGGLISVISHEIRNPLGGIRGFASLLVDDLANDSKKKELAESIVQGADRLYEILDRTVNYSRPFEIEKEEADLSKMIQEVLESCTVNKKVPKTITINKELPDQCLVPMQKSLIRSSLYNLIINAIQALKDQGTLTVRLIDGKKAVTVEIQDTGPGIPKDHLTKIFQPFFTTKPKGEGTGFGLAEVSQAIKAHHGWIDLESEEGVGTTFKVTLPKDRIA